MTSDSPGNHEGLATPLQPNQVLTENTDTKLDTIAIVTNIVYIHRVYAL